MTHTQLRNLLLLSDSGQMYGIAWLRCETGTVDWKVSPHGDADPDRGCWFTDDLDEVVDALLEAAT